MWISMKLYKGGHAGLHCGSGKIYLLQWTFRKTK